MYYHGTSYERVLKMFKTGFINCQPEKQIWPDQSGDFVYFFDEKLDAYAKYLAAEQATFALWSFRDKLRAIIEINPDELAQDRISPDPLHKDAVRYSEPISVRLIKNLYVEVDDSKAEFWREFAAIFKFEQRYHMYDSGFFKSDEQARKKMMLESGIPDLDLVAYEIWSKGSKLLDRAEDISDEAKDLDRFQLLNIELPQAL
jgi:hypothetical protein